MERICLRCSVVLTPDNVCETQQKRSYHVCASCENKRSKAKELKLKLDAFKQYGEVCICCKESNPVFLTIDHINGSGSSHRKEIGSRIYRVLKKQGYPKGNYQVLCFNCNFAKHVLGTCPHQTQPSNG